MNLVRWHSCARPLHWPKVRIYVLRFKILIFEKYLVGFMWKYARFRSGGRSMKTFIELWVDFSWHFRVQPNPWRALYQMSKYFYEKLLKTYNLFFLFVSYFRKSCTTPKKWTNFFTSRINSILFWETFFNASSHHRIVTIRWIIPVIYAYINFTGAHTQQKIALFFIFFFKVWIAKRMGD